MSRVIVLHVAAVEFTASRLLLPQLTYLADVGYDVRLACMPDGDRFAADLNRFDPRPVSFPRSFNVSAMAKAAIDLRRIVRAIRPALVHFHSPAASLPGRLVTALDRPEVRTVYTVHGFLHTWESHSGRDKIVGHAERILSHLTDALLFQSTEDFVHARAEGYKGHLQLIGNGVADNWFEVCKRPPRTGPLHAVFVGRLTREKGVRELLDVARQQPAIRWTVVGGALPSDRDSMESAVLRAAGDSNGRIRAVGMIEPLEVRDILASADLLVLPSWREGVPRSVIEAMATGLPVVATDIRGCRELVEPGITGWLVAPRCPYSLGAAISEAYGLPQRRLDAMGQAGREKVWRQFRERDVFQRLTTAYQAIGVEP